MAQSEVPHDFYYCNICRRSDARARKHVYGKKHKERVQFVLGKFGAKVKAAEVLIGHPEVIEGSFEKDATYWCYVCSCEVQRHAEDGLVTVKLAKFIEHLSCEAHWKATTKFMRVNHVETDKLKQQLAFTQEDYLRYKTNLEEALARYEDDSYSVLQESAAKIRQIESDRQRLLHGCVTSSSGQQETPPFASDAQHGHSLTQEGDTESTGLAAGGECRDLQKRPDVRQRMQPGRPQVLSRVRTIGVISSGGMTSVGTRAKVGAGNIHSGATPPWAMSSTTDSKNDGGQMVGPSEDDFKKHLERQKKRKLNPNRVGANFDHATATTEEWLPSFGRVWNSGRRWQSRRQYQGEKRRKKSERGTKRQPPHTESKPPQNRDYQ